MRHARACCYLVAAIAFHSTAAYAQSPLVQTSVWPGYPGSILIAPQQGNFLAPAIYRSVDDRDSLRHPIGVSQICQRDLEALQAKKTVLMRKPVTVAGFENQSTRIIGGKVNIDAKVVEASLNADYDQIVTLSTGAAQVYESDDDNISQTVLRNVGRECRKVIADHLKQRRWVFVAAKAIQAYDYDATFERVASASAAAKCTFLTWCRWVKGEGELKGKITDRTHGVASKTFVTIALVPAEVEVGRQSIEMADLQTLVPAREVRRFARRSRTAELSSMRDGRFAVATVRR